MAHAYHLLLLPIHLAARPGLRSLGVCLALVVAGRLTIVSRGGAAATLAGGVPIVAAWGVLAPVTDWPPTPVARLAGLGGIVLCSVLLAPLRAGRRRSRVVLSATAVLAGWWLRGAPSDIDGLVGCVPVVLALAACFAAADLLTHDDRGWGILAGAAVLAAALLAAGAAPHWGYAALAPAFAAAVLLGVPGTARVLARLTVMVGVAALVASDRGRVLSIDVACVAPLPVWCCAAWLRRRTLAGRL